MEESSIRETKNRQKKSSNLTSSNTVHGISENAKKSVEITEIKSTIKRSKSINTFKSNKEVVDKINAKKLNRNNAMLNSIENVYDCPKRKDKLLGMLKLNSKTSKYIKTKKNSENNLHRVNYQISNGKFFCLFLNI